MIIEKTGRTKLCTNCGVVAHNTVMQSHKCITQPLFTDNVKEKKTRKTKK